MIFKRPGRRHLLFTTVILSPSAQVALDESCGEQGCMYVRVQLPAILDSLVNIEGVIWPLVGGSDGIIELDPQPTLGSSQDTLEVLSQIDCSIHTEQITIISRTGEQKFNQNNILRFHRPDKVKQVQSQFQPNPLHEDPHSIDLNQSNSTQHRETTHLTQVRLFKTPPPPLYVAGITSLPSPFLTPRHQTLPRRLQ